MQQEIQHGRALQARTKIEHRQRIGQPTRRDAGARQGQAHRSQPDKAVEGSHHLRQVCDGHALCNGCTPGSPQPQCPCKPSGVVVGQGSVQGDAC